MEKRLYTKKELSELLGVTIKTIENYQKEGLEPTTYKPLRFTWENYINWDQSKNKK